MHDRIEKSIKGLQARMVEGVLCFDQPVTVRNMATATIRGLAGHLLREHRPNIADRWFKPGNNGDCPAAYVFQPMLEHSEMTQELPFRLITWDPPGEFIPALQAVMKDAAGRYFGEGDIRILGVEWTEICELAFEGVHNPPDFQKVVFRTPLRVKRGKGWLTEESLSLVELANGLLNRLNRLSREYGNGLQLEALIFEQHAVFNMEVERKLSLVRSARRSSTQGQNVDLSGLVGHISFQGLTAAMSSLLSVGGIIHLGKHTAEGCGCLVLV